jgi:hypothetical protein
VPDRWARPLRHELLTRYEELRTFDLYDSAAL